MWPLQTAHLWQGVEFGLLAGQALPAPHVGHRPPAAEPGAVTTPPDGLTLKHHRDLEGRERRPLVRWILVRAARALPRARPRERLRAAACDLDGERARRRARALLAEARPRRARVRVALPHQGDRARSATPRVVLDPGWLEGMTLNTVEPSPVGESSRDGRIASSSGTSPPATTTCSSCSSTSTRRTSATARPTSTSTTATRGCCTSTARSRSGPDGHRRPRSRRLPLRPAAHARHRAARAVVARAVRPDPARDDRRPRAAGRHAERLLGDRPAPRGNDDRAADARHLVHELQAPVRCGRCSTASP